jgi:aspartate aminotransferase
MKITPDDLKRNLRMRPHVRLFLLNNPVNPTAQLYDREEVWDLLHVCVENHVYFVLDRLYWKLVFDGQRFPELPVDDSTRPWIIQVDGMSKNFRRAGGLRIGWSVGPEDVTATMASLQSHYTSGPATPTQAAAHAALTHPYDGSLCRDLQDKRDLFRKEAADIPHIRLFPTPATFYSFWDVRGTFGKSTPDGRVINTSDDLASYLIAEVGVVAASGSAFMWDGYMRFCFATPDETIVEGMAGVRKALEALEPAA